MWRAAAFTAALLLPGAAGAAEPPPMAAVGLLTVGGRAACSGTLIAPDLVLTAGHCVLRRDRGGPVAAERLAFRTGAYPGHRARRFAASDVVVHPFYIGSGEGEAAWIPHDAGLVRLATTVPPGIARPIPVAGPGGEGGATFLASYRGGRGERARERRCPVLREWREVVSLSCDVRPGESGSPILLAGEGDELGLVGIVSASSRIKRTEVALAARAAGLIGALKALMGGF